MSPVSLYVNFVLHAVLGRLAEADALMRTFGPAVRDVAAALRARYPFEVKPLHRGIVLDGAFDATGREFVSWSEDPDVAGWFADPRSAMNTYVMAARPQSAGYVLTAPPSMEGVLFHHSWARLQDFPSLALQHPYMGVEGARQIAWSLRTQHEVITDPLEHWPELRPFVAERPPLDARLAPPWLIAA